MKISYPVFKSLVALSLGTLGVCMSEFSIMGILPEVAHSLSVSIPDAGHFISAYALGVCVGAPLTVLMARSRPLRSILLALMLVFIAGNTLTALAPNASMMLAARFIAGMPHGAYFGVASIVADKLAGRAFSVLAVSIVVSGATIANLVGVPGATLVTRILSWRVAYGIVAGVGLLVIIGVRAWVPQLPGLKDTGFRGQFRFLKFPAPWLIFLAIVLGNGGMFCWYSYISPFMGKVAGIDSVHMTLVMALAGLGMVLGNALSGRLSIRFPPTCIAEGMLAVMGTGPAAGLLFGTAYSNSAGSDVHLHRLPVRRFSPAADAFAAKRQRRGNARRRPGAGGFQYRQCHRGLLRRALHCRRARLRQYGPDRSAARRRGFSAASGIRPQIRLPHSGRLNRFI